MFVLIAQFYFCLVLTATLLFIIVAFIHTLVHKIITFVKICWQILNTTNIMSVNGAKESMVTV